MAELVRSCPDCGSIDVEVAGEVVIDPLKGAICPNCDWKGTVNETVGVASSEDFWTIERVGSVLLRVISKWGAGPMCQVFEYVGILEKDDQAARDVIMQAASAACIQAAFEAAHSIHLEKLKNKPEEELNEQEKKLVKAAAKRAN
jgi:hypothetical protein